MKLIECPATMTDKMLTKTLHSNTVSCQGKGERMSVFLESQRTIFSLQPLAHGETHTQRYHLFSFVMAVLEV